VAPTKPWELTWIESEICSAKDVQTLRKRTKGSWNVRSRPTRLPAKEMYLYQERSGHICHHDLRSVRARMDLSCCLSACIEFSFVRINRIAFTLTKIYHRSQGAL
jgi:hypothetical protein